MPRNAEASTFWATTSSGAITGRGERAWQKLKDTIRAKTRRTNGHSLPVIIADVNRTLRGWFEYFKHSHRHVRSDRSTAGYACDCAASCANVAAHGPWPRTRDHQRWPNAFFAEQGLFSLVTAHALACQSSRR